MGAMVTETLNRSSS